jgi:hypothetical protein
MTPAPVAGTLTVVPMFRLGRGLRLSSFRREWRAGLEATAAFVFTYALPGGVELRMDDSASYAEFLAGAIILGG